MYDFARLPLLPTATTGAYAVPGWLSVSRELMDEGKFGRHDVQEAFDDAVMVALDDQVRAGMDVVTDGEERRVYFILGFYDQMEGFRATEPFRKIGYPLYDQVTLWETTGRIAAPKGLGAVAEFNFLKDKTDRLIKMPIPGPLTLLTPIVVGEGYHSPDELADDFAQIIRTELEQLQAAGCQFVQIDEPAFHPAFQKDEGRVLQLFNDIVRGLTMKVALHVCFGNNAGRPRSRRTYKPFTRFMAEANAEQLVLEYANREMAEIEQWNDFGGDKELGAGVVDPKSFYRETAEDVAERIRQALKVVRPEKLWLNPDCGLNFTPRWIARAKLKALAEGAAIVRKELEGA